MASAAEPEVEPAPSASARYGILALLTLSQVGASIVQQGYGAIGPIMIATLGISKGQFGAIFSAMVFGTAAFTALTGALTDKLGERRILALSATLMTAALLAAAAIQNYLWLVVTMFAFGITYSAQPLAGTRAVMAWFERDRAFAMSVRQTGVPLGGMIGALVLPFIALHFGGYRMAFAVSAVVVAVSSVIVLAAYRDRGEPRRASSPSYGGLLRAMPGFLREPRLLGLCITGVGLMGLQQATLSFLTVTNVSAVGMNPAVAAGVFALSQAAAVVGRLMWSWVSDRFLNGERYLVIAGLSVIATFAAVLVGSLRPDTQMFAVAAAVMIGLSAAGWNGVFLAAVSEIGSLQTTGSIIGVSSTIIFVASALTPGTFGLIAQHASLAVAWYVFAAIAAIGVVPPLRAFLGARRAERPA